MRGTLHIAVLLLAVGSPSVAKALPKTTARTIPSSRTRSVGSEHPAWPSLLSRNAQDVSSFFGSDVWSYKPTFALDERSVDIEAPPQSSPGRQSDLSRSDSTIVSQYTSETAFDSTGGSSVAVTASPSGTRSRIFTGPTTLSSPFCQSSGWCTLMATCSALFPTGYIECNPSATTIFPDYPITNYPARNSASSKPLAHSSVADTRTTVSQGVPGNVRRANNLNTAGGRGSVSLSSMASKGLTAFTTTVKVGVTIVETIHRPTSAMNTSTLATSPSQISAGVQHHNTTRNAPPAATASTETPTTSSAPRTDHSTSSSSGPVHSAPQSTRSSISPSSHSMATSLRSQSANPSSTTARAASVKGGCTGAETVGLGGQRISQGCRRTGISGAVVSALIGAHIASMVMI